LDRQISTRSIWLNIQIDKSTWVLLDLFIELEALVSAIGSKFVTTTRSPFSRVSS